MAAQVLFLSQSVALMLVRTGFGSKKNAKTFSRVVFREFYSFQGLWDY